MMPTTDRLTGVLVAAACADALGAGYEFGAPLADHVPVEMRGQGGFAPGEWTDDTAQLVAIAMAAADGFALDSDEGLDAVAGNFFAWYLSPASSTDIGIHTGQVFREVTQTLEPGFSRTMRAVAARKEERSPHSSGGNGALMRTAPVALAYWDDPERMVRVAKLIAGLTHADPGSDESCAVWCLAIRAALLTSHPEDISELARVIEADVRTYLPDVADFWCGRLQEAFGQHPSSYYSVRPGNGYCVTALQCAWAAITYVPVPTSMPGEHLRRATEAAVRCGNDTDTVACIAGAVLGALWGASAVPLAWRRRVFGWPDMRDADLVGLADAIAHGRRDQWPQSSHVDYSAFTERFALVPHPHDPEVLLAGAAAAQGDMSIDGPPIGAVVSLCRMGRDDYAHFDLDPDRIVQVWLIDTSDGNPNLDLVLRDAADEVRRLRLDGHRVLLHCVESVSRTPSVAAMYSVRHLDVKPAEAIGDVLAALPRAHLQAEFLASVRRAWDN